VPVYLLARVGIKSHPKKTMKLTGLGFEKKTGFLPILPRS